MTNILLSIAIKDCWGSTTDQVAADGSAAVYDSVKFLENQCPKYSWVDNTANALTDFSNLEIELFQFAFNDGTGTLTNDFFYHCEVKRVLVVSKR